MSYIPSNSVAYFLDNQTSSATLGGVITNAFQRSVGIPCFHSTRKTHIASQSAIHILANATNDSDANEVRARISLSPSSNAQVGAAIAHKSSIVMIPNTILTYQDQPTEITSAVLDTGDVVTADNLNILIISCGVIS